MRKADFIIKDEGSRRLRLRILLLESENDDLHEQLALADDRIDILEQDCEKVRAEQEHAEADACRYENELRVQTRELSNLKVRRLCSLQMAKTDLCLGRADFHEWRYYGLYKVAYRKAFTCS